MRLAYFTHNIQWPETCNHPDVMDCRDAIGIWLCELFPLLQRI